MSTSSSSARCDGPSRRWHCGTLFLAFVLASACATSQRVEQHAKGRPAVQAGTVELGPPPRDIEPVMVGSVAEWHPPKAVLVHTPGDELLLGVLHPPAALFEDSFDWRTAAREHEQFIRQLEAMGANVFRVVDVLLSGALDEQGNPVEGPALRQLREAALGSVSVAHDSDDPRESERQLRHVADAIAKLNPKDLVRVVMLGPTIKISSTTRDTGFIARYEVAPLMNLYFTRDHVITTGKGVVLGRMAPAQRRRELDVIKLVLSKLGVTPLYQVASPGTLEGGDFIPAGGHDFIGVGLRTNDDAVNQLLEQQAFSSDTVVVVRDKLRMQSQMHLDTYFNVIGEQLVLLAENRTAAPLDSDARLTADIYKFGEHGYELVTRGTDFVEYLGAQGMTVLPVSIEDQLRYGVNVLTTGDRKVMAVRGISDELQQRFRDHGVTVEMVGFDQLKNGYGATHCTTQVLHRRP